MEERRGLVLTDWMGWTLKLRLVIFKEKRPV